MGRRHRSPSDARRDHMFVDSDARRDHMFVDTDGRLRSKARLSEAQARDAAERVFALTGREWTSYACRLPECGASHIRPVRRRQRSDLARSA